MTQGIAKRGEDGRRGASGAGASTGRARRKGERGMALILALVMIALLGLLGAMALYTSSTELRITGNYRSSQSSFFTGDAAVEYATADPAIYTAMTMSPTSANNTWPVAGAGDWPVSSPPSTMDKNYTTVTTLGDYPARVRVQFEACGQAPAGLPITAEYSMPGSGSSPVVNKVNYLLISVVGVGPNGTPTGIDTSQMRLALDCLP